MTTSKLPPRKRSKTLLPQSPNFELNNKYIGKEQCALEEGDHISLMPDEVLVSILCLLTMKEAAKTSLLSRRWRYLWRFTTKLNFDDDSRDRKPGVVRIAGDDRRLPSSGFVNWVNQVLRSHKALILDAFAIRTVVDDRSHKYDLDSWFEFAIERKIKRLEFGFYPFQGLRPLASYTLTTRKLEKYSLASLTTLRLQNVDLTGEVLQHILCNCPLLKSLSIVNAISLVDVKVSGFSLRLKYLEIINRWPIEKIEISSLNLVKLIYQGQVTRILISNLPCLVKAHFGGPYSNSLIKNLSRVSCCFSQLEVLELQLFYVEADRFRKCVELKNLKQLILAVYSFDYYSLSCCKSALKACPMLHRYTLKMTGLKFSSKWKLPRSAAKARNPHQSLKVFQLSGFVGHGPDIKMALYVAASSVALEKMIIRPDTILSRDQKLVARQCARELETRLPSGVELVIL